MWFSSSLSHGYLYICMHICILCIYVYTYSCKHMHTHVHCAHPLCPTNIYVHVCIYIYICIITLTYIYAHIYTLFPFSPCYGYGVASASRIDLYMGLFCKRALQKRQHSAKETYHLIDPTNRSHPILPARRNTMLKKDISAVILHVQSTSKPTFQVVGSITL